MWLAHLEGVGQHTGQVAAGNKGSLEEVALHSPAQVVGAAAGHSLAVQEVVAAAGHRGCMLDSSPEAAAVLVAAAAAWGIEGGPAGGLESLEGVGAW